MSDSSVVLMGAGLEKLSSESTRASQSILLSVAKVRMNVDLVARLAGSFSAKSEGAKGAASGDETQLIQAFESMSPLISSIAQATRNLQSGAFLDALESSDNVLVEMRMISVMLKIDAATLQGADNAIVSFASRFSDLTQQLQIEIDNAKKVGRAVQKHIAAAKSYIDSAFCETQAHSARIKDIFLETDALLQQRNDAFKRINQETGAVTQSCSNAIQVLLPSMQFSDAFSQRSGNARKILAMADDHGPDVAAAARFLVAKQLFALGNDTEFTRARSDEALDSIYSAAFRCQQFLTGKDDLLAVAKIWLESKANATKDAEASCNSLNAVFCETFRQIDLVLDQGKILTGQIRAFDDLAMRMGVEATNGWIAGVRADRSNPGCMATTYLAGEVKSRDVKLSEILANCSRVLTEADSAMTSINRADINQALTIMSDLKTTIVADLAQHAQSKDELSVLSDEIEVVLRDLVAACKDAREIGRTMAKFSTELKQLVGSLDASAPARMSGVDLEWAWPIYTTTEERKVHQSLFGPRETAAPVEDIFDDDDDMAGFLI